MGTESCLPDSDSAGSAGMTAAAVTARDAMAKAQIRSVGKGRFIPYGPNDRAQARRVSVANEGTPAHEVHAGASPGALG